MKFLKQIHILIVTKVVLKYTIMANCTELSQKKLEALLFCF